MDFEKFEAVFDFRPDIAYDHKTVDQVLRNRHALENELFFDRLLKALGVSQGQYEAIKPQLRDNFDHFPASKLYPPRSNQDLRTLHGRIISSASPDHHKQSLLYYILKDIPHSSQVAEGFAKECFLPSKYRIFIDGLWFLDRLRFEVNYGRTHPSASSTNGWSLKESSGSSHRTRIGTNFPSRNSLHSVPACTEG